MYDYKFRQNTISFRKPKRRLRRFIFALLLFFVASGTLYMLIGWGLEGLKSATEGDQDGNIIPLALPPEGGS